MKNVITAIILCAVFVSPMMASSIQRAAAKATGAPSKLLEGLKKITGKQIANIWKMSDEQMEALVELDGYGLTYQIWGLRYGQIEALGELNDWEHALIREKLRENRSFASKLKQAGVGLVAAIVIACTAVGCGSDSSTASYAMPTGEQVGSDDLNLMYNHYYVGRSVYYTLADGTVELGTVVAYRHNGGAYLFMLATPDGGSKFILEEQIGGELLEGHPNTGAAIEFVGDISSQRLTGVIDAAYGGYEIQTRFRHGVGEMVDSETQVVDYYVVTLDSGEKRTVPSGSVTAWLD